MAKYSKKNRYSLNPFSTYGYWDCSVHFNWSYLLTNTLGKEAMCSEPYRQWMVAPGFDFKKWGCRAGIIHQGTVRNTYWEYWPKEVMFQWTWGWMKGRDRRKTEGEDVWPLLALLTCVPLPFYELCCTGLFLPLVYSPPAGSMGKWSQNLQECKNLSVLKALM